MSSNGDEYILYYVARYKEAGRQCISYAVADSPAGPFVDPNDKPFICQLDEGGSIDPEPFVDADGSLHLIWKSDANALNRSLSTASAGDDGRTCWVNRSSATRDQDGSARWSRIQRRCKTVSPICSTRATGGGNYALGFAICDGPSGPCQKPLDEPFFSLPTSRIGGEIGPGGGSFFRDQDGNPWIAYHAWRSPSAGYASGGQRRLSITR